MPSLFEKTKESLNNAAESVKDTLYGNRDVEDRAAQKVRDAADWTADTIGEAREDMNEQGKPLMETMKEKLGDAVEYTKECAQSAKEALFGGEHTISGDRVISSEAVACPALPEERRTPIYNPKENTAQNVEMFKGIRDNNEDTPLPHVHDY